MKILCISDYEDPFIYSPAIKDSFKDIDIILSSGDLNFDYYDYISSTLNKPLYFVFGNHNLKYMKYYSRRYKSDENLSLHENKDFKNLNTNYENDKEEEEIECNIKEKYGAIYVGGRIKKIKNLIIAGLGGSMKYNKGMNQFTEIGMFFYHLKIIPRLLLNKIIHGRYLDILLTHAPPRGIHDKNDRCHTGFKVFLWFMRIFKPKYLIHGHIHIYDLNKNRITNFYKTNVINAYRYTVIEY